MGEDMLSDSATRPGERRHKANSLATETQAGIFLCGCTVSSLPGLTSTLKKGQIVRKEIEAKVISETSLRCTLGYDVSFKDITVSNRQNEFVKKHKNSIQNN